MTTDHLHYRLGLCHLLLEAGDRRADKLARYQEATAELHALIREADAAGVPKAQIAQLAQISRQTVHSILRRHG